MICAGIDGGSRAVKAVLLDAGSRQVLCSGVCDQQIDHDAAAARLLDELLASAGHSRTGLRCVVATGYARNRITCATTTITEITCHAAGVRHVVPEARSIIEVGGQDSKLIRLDEGGSVRDFAMNDRCAAGTGRFLEIVAGRLDTALLGLGELSRCSTSPSSISSTCVVFAETEIIGLLASGTPPADIIAGVQNAMCSRIVAMAGRSLEGPVVFTGGVAMLTGMREALEQALRQPLIPAPQPQLTGALGAALLAAGMLTD